ncbi:hypothetical protein P8452_15987 [Trifolium repens]|nr:hypothetical protein P8452_15987 [Trifolium repens]
MIERDPLYLEFSSHASWQSLTDLCHLLFSEAAQASVCQFSKMAFIAQGHTFSGFYSCLSQLQNQVCLGANALSAPSPLTPTPPSSDSIKNGCVFKDIFGLIHLQYGEWCPGLNWTKPSAIV